MKTFVFKPDEIAAREGGYCVNGKKGRLFIPRDVATADLLDGHVQLTVTSKRFCRQITSRSSASRDRSPSMT